MRKKIVAILLAATMAIGITACGNQSESNKDDNTITVWCWDMLVGPGELIEQRRFAAVLISDQCKDHAPTSGRISICAASSMRSVSS